MLYFQSYEYLLLNNREISTRGIGNVTKSTFSCRMACKWKDVPAVNSRNSQFYLNKIKKECKRKKGLLRPFLGNNDLRSVNFLRPQATPMATRIANYLSYNKYHRHARRWILTCNKPKNKIDEAEPNTNCESTASCCFVSSYFRNEGNLTNSKIVSIFGEMNHGPWFSLCAKQKNEKLP